MSHFPPLEVVGRGSEKLEVGNLNKLSRIMVNDDRRMKKNTPLYLVNR